VVGDLAYVADGLGGLRILDVSNPAIPVELGALYTPGEALDVAVVGDLAYVADGLGGLRILDVSTPAFPAELGALDTPGYAFDVEVVGDLAYVADGRSGLRILDVSNPAFPVELGALDTPDVAWGVAVVGDLAYVADGYSGLRIVDVSNPAFPVEPGALDTPGRARDVEVVGDLAYVAGSGLRIFDFGPEYAGSIEIDLDIKPGGEPNAIHLAGGGVIPVAILGSDVFDIAEVDATTLAFGPGDASLAHWRGPHPQDVNGDGLLDLVAHFRTEETGIAFGDRVACLAGETLEGKGFEGCDSVRTVPDMDGDSLLDVAEEAIGTHALRLDTDGDGFGDGEEAHVMGTNPLDPLDPTPTPVREPRRKGKRRR
jgi:hypothetical protein